MKMCEYVNNFISLEMLYNQVKTGKIKNVSFIKEFVFSSIPKILYYNQKDRFNNYSISIRIEKEAHKPLHEFFGQRETFSGESLINTYIKKYGIIPLYLKIETSHSKWITIEEKYKSFKEYPKDIEIYFYRFL